MFQKQHFYSSFSRVQAGAIAGGVVGGIAVITAVVVALLFCRRKPRPVEFNEQPTVMPFSQYNVEQPPPVPPPSQNTMANVPTSAPLFSPTSHYSNGVYNDGTPPQQTPTASPSSTNFLVGRPMESSAQLSEEQAPYMRNLYSLNVPASASTIAAMDGRLLEGGTRGVESSDFVGDFKRHVRTVATPPTLYRG